MMTKTLVFDFDGTVFKLFVNSDRSEDVLKLKKLLEDHKIDSKNLKDIFDVFKMTSDLDILREAHKLVTECELRCLNEGEEVKGFSEFVKYATDNGLEIGIVSNNSNEVIKKFFESHYPNLDVQIMGRDEMYPNILKPDKFLLDKWISKYYANRSFMIYIGDNKRDYECALNCGVRFIGLTPTDKKRKNMEEALSNVEIFNDYFELIAYLKTL